MFVPTAALAQEQPGEGVLARQAAHPFPQPLVDCQPVLGRRKENRPTLLSWGTSRCACPVIVRPGEDHGDGQGRLAEGHGRSRSFRFGSRRQIGRDFQDRVAVPFAAVLVTPATKTRPFLVYCSASPRSFL